MKERCPGVLIKNGGKGNCVLFTQKCLFNRIITMKNPDDLAKTQLLTKNTDIIFTHEICGLNTSLKAKTGK